MYLEKPCITARVAEGGRSTLLRGAMLEAGRIGIARVVMHAKESLAALVPDGEAQRLDTIRRAGEIRPRDEIALPAAGKGLLRDGGPELARQRTGDMTSAWKPLEFAGAGRETGAAQACDRASALAATEPRSDD